MTTVAERVAERVARGVAFLDEKAPGWDKKIDLDILDITSCRKCMLGQLFGDYYSDTGDKFFSSYENTRASLGFDADPWDVLGGFHPQYAALTDEWKRVILARRSDTQEKRINFREFL